MLVGGYLVARRRRGRDTTGAWSGGPFQLVILIRALHYGGAERQIVELAKGLHGRGHRVSVAVFYPGGPFEAELREVGVPLVSFDKRGRWDIAGFFLRLAAYLRRERPHLFHGYLSMPNLVALALRPVFGGKVVWGLGGSDVDLRDFDWLERAVLRAECLLSRFADLSIANSYAGKAIAVGCGFPPDRVVVISNGIDTDRFRPDPEAGRRVRLELGVPADALLVGLVGRIAPQKDHPTFLRAAAQLDRHADVRFACVGAGPAAAMARLQAMAADLGLGDRVLWTGGRSDMAAVYNALDVLVLPSAYGEGFANVIGEAMACGTPCVVSDVGDSAYAVGDLGWVVPKRDPAALATALTAALDAVAAGSVDAAALRARIVDGFSLPRLVDRTEEALVRLLEEPERL